MSTCRKLEARDFREDLYYRLNVIPVQIPPLRERLVDLSALCQQILGRIARARGNDPLALSSEALTYLSEYSWPGNVRELENVLERASAFCDGPALEKRHFPFQLASATAPGRAASPAPAASPVLAGKTLDEVERLAIQQTLEMCGGNKASAARHLGITEKTIYNKMRRLGMR